MRKLIAPLAAAAALAACASPTQQSVDEGRQLISQGNLEEGLAKLEEVSREYPLDTRARNAYVTQREAIVQVYLREGDTLRTWGDLDAAEASYRRALKAAPGSASVQSALDVLARDRRHLALVREAEAALKQGDLATPRPARCWPRMLRSATRGRSRGWWPSGGRRRPRPSPRSASRWPSRSRWSSAMRRSAACSR
jgi:tetratricopeptide (TPR) repeat protein